MRKLFIGNKNYSSWSLRPWVLMRALCIPFEEVLVPFDGVDNYQRFKAFAPNGRVPCLEDDQGVVWDSMAITEVLAEDHPEVWPIDRAARRFARAAAAEMHSGFQSLRSACPMICSATFSMLAIPDGLSRELTRLDEIFSEGIVQFGGPYLAGRQFTAVDASFVPVAIRVIHYGLPVSKQSRDYCNQSLKMPAVVEWLDAAIQEPWFDLEEETAARRLANLLEDVRPLTR